MQAPTTSSAAAIAVVYQPDEHSVQCVLRLTDAFSHTIVVDNASNTAQARHLFDALKTKNDVVVIRNGENLGIAAALNVGIEEARRRGHTWFYLSDQDTELVSPPLPAAQAAYSDFVRDHPTKPVGLIGAGFAIRNRSSSSETVAAERRYLLETAVITSGTWLPLSTFERVGPLREDFFIDSVDYEYCLRVHRAGLAVIRSAQPTLLQSLGNYTPYRGIMSFYKLRGSFNYSPLRRYYAARNLVVLRREFKADFPVFIKKVTGDFLRECVRILKYEPNCIQKFLMIARGVRDAYRNRLGRFKG